MMVIRNIETLEAQIMKKFSKTETELKKAV